MARPVLASDAEREACAARLRDVAAEGRLEVDELDERVGAAYRARTRLDLARLTADLPPSPARAERTQRLRRLVAAGGVANVALLGLWLADVGAMRDPVILGLTQFDVPWPAILLAGWSALAAATWRRRLPDRTTQDALLPTG